MTDVTVCDPREKHLVVHPETSATEIIASLIGPCLKLLRERQSMEVDARTRGMLYWLVFGTLVAVVIFVTAVAMSE